MKKESHILKTTLHKNGTLLVKLNIPFFVLYSDGDISNTHCQLKRKESFNLMFISNLSLKKYYLYDKDFILNISTGHDNNSVVTTSRIASKHNKNIVKKDVLDKYQGVINDESLVLFKGKSRHKVTISDKEVYIYTPTSIEITVSDPKFRRHKILSIIE